jgi:hypothetical protein
VIGPCDATHAVAKQDAEGNAGQAASNIDMVVDV